MFGTDAAMAAVVVIGTDGDEPATVRTGLPNNPTSGGLTILTIGRFDTGVCPECQTHLFPADGVEDDCLLKVNDPCLVYGPRFVHLRCYDGRHPSLAPIFELGCVEDVMRAFGDARGAAISGSPFVIGWECLSCRERLAVLRHLVLSNQTVDANDVDFFHVPCDEPLPVQPR